MSDTYSKIQELHVLIDALRSELPEVQGVLVASLDGFVLAHKLTHDPSRLAAMAATTLSLGKRVVYEVGGQGVAEAAISSHDAHAFFYTAGTRGVLAVLTPGDANVGLVHFKCREAAPAIGRMVDKHLTDLKLPTALRAEPSANKLL